jgi:hypothetical protein
MSTRDIATLLQEMRCGKSTGSTCAEKHASEPGCWCDSCEAWAAIQRLQSPHLCAAFRDLSQALYWSLIPAPAERALVSERLHRLHVAVHRACYG